VVTVRLVAAALLASAAAGAAVAAPLAITGATIHPVSGPPIENGVLVMDGGVIVDVGGADTRIPASAERVEAGGLHLWPGLVDARSYLGLVEIGSVRGTRDHTESGEMNPNARAEVAINASSSHLPVTRANGILLAAAVPYGTMVPGTAAAVALDGWTWEELVRKAPIGLVIRWPKMGVPEEPEEDEKKKEKKKPERPEWEERIARLDEMIAEARGYEAARAGGPAVRDADARWESLRSVIDGQTPVWIEATNLTQIRSALDWTEKHGLRMVLVDGDGTGGDAWRVAGELAARGIPVICRTNRRPARAYEPYDTPFAAPGKLREAGVVVAFGSWAAAHARNLPQEAARAAAFGMGHDEAVRALTLGGAAVLGIDDRYGSLDPGKSATMILTDDDVLETRMLVVRAWIDGREIDLESRHTELWRKWQARPAAVAAEAMAAE
jgi:imidazolonepropionase-like amidohydrolase